MERFVQYIRENYRKVFNVIEVNDLPLVLLTEVINQAILQGATRIKVTTDGKSILVHDNATPYEEDYLQWMVSYHAMGMMDPARQRLRRIIDRQWASPPFCTINALCREFKLLVSTGDSVRCVVCRDGLVVSDEAANIDLEKGNLVIMDPMIELYENDVKAIGEMMEMIADRYPRIAFEFRSNA